MGIFKYTCPEHGSFKKMMDRGGKSISCPQCGLESKRKMEAGTVHITEVIDNGLMARAVERPTNIDELIEQRADIKDKSDADDT